MPPLDITEDALRQMLKQAVAEALEERRDLLRDVVAEVLEDYGLAHAIREGQRTEAVSRDEVFAHLTGAR